MCLLLTNKNKPGEFLSHTTLGMYGSDVTRALGVKESTCLSRQAAIALQTASRELGEAAVNVNSITLQDL